MCQCLETSSKDCPLSSNGTRTHEHPQQINKQINIKERREHSLPPYTTEQSPLVLCVCKIHLEQQTTHMEYIVRLFDIEVVCQCLSNCGVDIYL